MHPAFDTLVHQVSAALDEDLGPEARDLTAELIPASHQAEARLICREPALVAGSPGPVKPSDRWTPAWR